jgi:hypothetical protein
MEYGVGGFPLHGACRVALALALYWHRVGFRVIWLGDRGTSIRSESYLSLLSRYWYTVPRIVVLKSCTSEMRLVRRSAYNWGSGASVAKGNTLEGLYWLMVISNG